MVDHSSNMPDPVALSSAKVEYNEGCIAFMAASHLQMLSHRGTKLPTLTLFSPF
jgi:hypothetical protein